jgi:hypothetical protein
MKPLVSNPLWTLIEPLVEAIPPLRTGRPGRPRHRPEKLHGDKGYNYQRCRAACRHRRLTIRYERLVAVHRAFLYLGILSPSVGGMYPPSANQP